MQVLADKSHLYTDAAGFVDVRKLIAAYTEEEHAARAEQYFREIHDPWVHHLRKPFHSPEEARVTITGLAAILAMGNIRPGEDVVDFGCGTGWLTGLLALMGCRPIAMDVSAEALRLAQVYMQTLPSLRDAPIRYQITSRTLPLADDSVDKIICFDVFHHMPDQHATILEFARVLRPGGLVLFHEPGPGHSLSAVAQQEMRDFAVIENEVDVEGLWSVARSAGFSRLEMAVYTDKPLLLTERELRKYQGNRASKEDLANLGSRLLAHQSGNQVFSMKKEASDGLDTGNDSRSRAGLAGLVTLLGVEAGEGEDEVRVSLTIKNTGVSWWRPSGPGVGSVNLDVSVSQTDGQSQSLFRSFFSNTPVRPGETRRADFSLPRSVLTGRDPQISFGLVSEMVGWFSDVGSAALSLPGSGFGLN